MVYDESDFDALYAAVFDTNGLWEMMKKDLWQIADSPFRFNTVLEPQFGTGPNLSLVIVTMSALETISTLANINNAIRGRQQNFGTDVVCAFGERYLSQVNPRYSSPSGESTVRLLWDCYRNGGVHRFLPKMSKIKNQSGQDVQIVFTVNWLLDKSRQNQSYTLEEVQRLRNKDPELRMLSQPHLGITSPNPSQIQYHLCAQAFLLEFAESVEKWKQDLQPRTSFSDWFIDGANAFDLGRRLSCALGLNRLRSLISTPHSSGLNAS